MKTRSLLIFCAVCAPFKPYAQDKPAASILSVIGNVGKPLSLTNADLTKQFAATVGIVRYTLKKEKARARAVPLLTILQAAQPQLDPKRKNAVLAYAVVLSSDDGYTVTFSMGELLPEYGKSRVWLALDKNDKPLSAKEAPVSLLVPGDTKPSRWIHAIKTIQLINTAPPVAQGIQE